MNPLRKVTLVVLVALSVFIAACTSQKDANNDNNPNSGTSGGNWDTMLWDQDNWS